MAALSIVAVATFLGFKCPINAMQVRAIDHVLVNLVLALPGLFVNMVAAGLSMADVLLFFSSANRCGILQWSWVSGMLIKMWFHGPQMYLV